MALASPVGMTDTHLLLRSRRRESSRQE